MPVRSRVLLALTLATTGACFDAGHDYAVTVTWLINGLAPSEAVCDAYGVDRVRLTTSSATKTRSVEAPCASSVEVYFDGDYLDYGGFDTTVAFDYGVRYRYHVEMLDAAGEVIAAYDDTLEAYFGDPDPWVLDALELFEPEGDWASISAHWTIDGETATDALCAEAGIETVAIDVASVTDQDFVDFVEMARAICGDGALLTEPILGPGEYFIRYTALNEADEPVDEYVASETYLVDTTGELNVMSATF